MQIGRFPECRRREIRKHIDTLAAEHLSELIALAQDGTIPASGVPVVDGMSLLDFEHELRRSMRGERPFEDWMYAHGTYEEVVEIYQEIDEWLVKNGIVTCPGPMPKRR